VLADVYRRIEMMRLSSQLSALFPLQLRILPGLVMKLRTSIGVPFQ
jgi:hypothetical protein